MQGSKKCAFRRHNAKHVFEIEERRMPKDAADSNESVDITFLTVGASVWEFKKNPYKNNRDPTCWLGPLIIIIKILTKTIGIQSCWLGPLIKILTKTIGIQPVGLDP